MADIELVIKIPKEIYNYVQRIGSIPILDTQQIANAIFDGKPLPKGHGRLVDECMVKQMIEDAEVKYDNSKTFAENIIRFTPTVIEADEGDE